MLLGLPPSHSKELCWDSNQRLIQVLIQVLCGGRRVPSVSRGQSRVGVKNRVTDTVWPGAVLGESYEQCVC